MQGEEPAPPTTTKDTPSSHSQAASQAPSSSRATPSSGSVAVPVDRVQKLEAQMATLLQHVKPLIQRSIAESVARMEQMMDHKVQAIHQRLDAFKLRISEQPAPTIDVSSFQTELASLRDDLDALLAPPKTEPKSSPTAPVENTVLDALFGEEIPSPVSFCHARNNPRSSQTFDGTEAGKSRKREHQELEAARRASIIDEELRHQRAREIGVGAFSSMSTTDGAARVDVSTTKGAETVDAGTTEGDPIVDLASFGKPNSPAC
uniref:Integrase core domain containing protein n=1 Tax=Solanum tuberosum TaxID=4113 RepID=M1DH42_SOLTU